MKHSTLTQATEYAKVMSARTHGTYTIYNVPASPGLFETVNGVRQEAGAARPLATYRNGVLFAA